MFSLSLTLFTSNSYFILRLRACFCIIQGVVRDLKISILISGNGGDNGADDGDRMIVIVMTMVVIVIIVITIMMMII